MTTPADDTARVAAVARLCSGRPGYHTITVKELLTAMSDAVEARQVLGTPTTAPAPAGICADCGARFRPGMDVELEHECPETDELLRRAAASAPAAPADRAADRRDRYADALQTTAHQWWQTPPRYVLAADAVMAVADAEVVQAMRAMHDTKEEEREAHRLALSEALGLGTGAPWDAIRDRAAELRRLADEAQPTEIEAAPWPSTTQYAVEVREVDDWVGVTYHRPTLAEAQERRDAYRRRSPNARFRIVRWDETATVAEADPEPATAATEEPQP